MVNGQTVLGVIPARGGSKRVPRKNLQLFRGKPLLLWAIEQGKASRYIDVLCVSSDDDEILALAMSTETKVIRRPDVLATDDAKSEDVMKHALTIFPCDLVVLLQPTSPLREVRDIDGTIWLAQYFQAAVSVSSDGKTNGAVYACDCDWLNEHDFKKSAVADYPMPKWRSLDINEAADFLI